MEERENAHSSRFKNVGKSFERIRKDRQATNIELRKNKREELIEKKRNISLYKNIEQTSIRYTDPEQILKVVADCANCNNEIYTNAILNLRLYLSSEKVKYIDEILSHGVIDILANRLSPVEECNVRYNAAWALTNIASGSTYQTSHLLKNHVILALISIMYENNAMLVEQAIWALSNVVGDGPNARLFVLSLNLLDPMMHVFNEFNTNIKIMDQLSWLLINVCRKKEKEVPFDYILKIVEILLKLFDISDETVIGNAIWCVTHLSDSSLNHIKVVVSSNIVDKVFPYLHSTHKLIVSSIRAVGNIAASTDEMTQYLLDHDIYSHLLPILNSPDSKIKKELYWLLSNIAAGTRDHMLSIYSLNIFPQIIHDLDTGDYPVQKEACWVISNVIHTCILPEVQQFIDSRVLFMLVKFLRGSDTSMIIMVLEVYLILLKLYNTHNKTEYICKRIEETGAVNYIETLQHHRNDTIYNYVATILQQYFFDEVSLNNIDDSPIINTNVPSIYKSDNSHSTDRFDF